MRLPVVLRWVPIFDPRIRSGSLLGFLVLISEGRRRGLVRHLPSRAQTPHAEPPFAVSAHAQYQEIVQQHLNLRQSLSESRFHLGSSVARSSIACALHSGDQRNLGTLEEQQLHESQTAILRLRGLQLKGSSSSSGFRRFGGLPVANPAGQPVHDV